jgi:hypothetical protein
MLQGTGARSMGKEQARVCEGKRNSSASLSTAAVVLAPGLTRLIGPSALCHLFQVAGQVPQRSLRRSVSPIGDSAKVEGPCFANRHAYRSAVKGSIAAWSSGTAKSRCCSIAPHVCVCSRHPSNKPSLSTDDSHSQLRVSCAYSTSHFSSWLPKRGH